MTLLTDDNCCFHWEFVEKAILGNKKTDDEVIMTKEGEAFTVVFTLLQQPIKNRIVLLCS